MKYILPYYIINKIYLYNIHLTAEILKPLFNEYNTNRIYPEFRYDSCYEYILDHFTNNIFCYYCRINILNCSYIINRYNLCKDCFDMSDPNDDIYLYTPYEILENKIIANKVLFEILELKIIANKVVFSFRI